MKKILGICPRCAFITTSKNVRFCPNCGLHLMDRCPACGALLSYPIARYCPECGICYDRKHKGSSQKKKPYILDHKEKK
jgi:anaerobic ribonucleoside-triphosphate reductase